MDQMYNGPEQFRTFSVYGCPFYGAFSKPSRSVHLDVKWQRQDFCSDRGEHKTEELHKQSDGLLFKVT